VAARGLPLYRRTADDILAMLADGRLSAEFTVPEAAKLAGVKDWAARKAAEHLAERGMIESHQGTGYRALITAEQAAAARVDDRPITEQVAELRQKLDELATHVGRMDAQLATVAGKPRGNRDQSRTAAGGGRQ
jgi:DNA-binding GntR family transcriptional regulator